MNQQNFQAPQQPVSSGKPKWHKQRNSSRPKQVAAAEPVAQDTARAPTAQASQSRPPSMRTGQPRATGLAASAGTNPNPSLAPRALSTTLTAERNDVLLTDAILVDGINAGVPCEKDRHFKLDYSQYIQIIMSSYRVMTRQDRGLQKYISLSQYQYYCIVLLWRRIKYVLTARGDGVNSYEALKRKLPPMAIPNEIGHYLDGIGNITDYNERRYWLALQDSLRTAAVLGIPGHYGRVDETNHINYESLPAPFVAVYRIMMDLAVTDGQHQRPMISVDHNWDLPDDLKPMGSFMVNRNLLGWAPAEPLTDEQERACHAAGLSATVSIVDNVIVPDFNTSGVENFEGLPIVYPLLLSISEVLSAAKSNQLAYNAYAESSSTKGSIAITGFNERRADTSTRLAGVNLPAIYARESTGLVYAQASVHIMSAISLFRYRVKRVVHGFNDSLCYTGPQGGAPPGWPQTADDVFESAPAWNYAEFRTTLVSGRLVCDTYSHNIRKVPASERQ